MSHSYLRSDLKNTPFWAVLAVESAAIGYAGFSPQHWLRAVGIMSLGLFGAALCRALLSDDQAGLLRVRGRAIDVGVYLALGVLAITFGLALPQR